MASRARLQLLKEWRQEHEVARLNSFPPVNRETSGLSLLAEVRVQLPDVGSRFLDLTRCSWPTSGSHFQIEGTSDAQAKDLEFSGLGLSSSRDISSFGSDTFEVVIILRFVGRSGGVGPVLLCKTSPLTDARRPGGKARRSQAAAREGKP